MQDGNFGHVSSRRSVSTYTLQLGSANFHQVPRIQHEHMSSPMFEDAVQNNLGQLHYSPCLSKAGLC